MAGIGFELKKLFQRKGFFASVQAFGYATVVTTGPMLLSVILLLGIMGLCTLTGMAKADRELLVCMITYTLLASVSVSSCLSMVVTRHTADMLFEGRNAEVLPSFWGSCILMMVIGALLWIPFLVFSGATLVQGILLYVFFEEMLVVWHAMSYLTALKDYRGIFRSFFVAIAVSLLLGLVLILLKFPVLESLLFSVSFGYGIKLLSDVILLHRYFPRPRSSPFAFMNWVDKFRPLALIGMFTNLGLFSHLVIMWFSPIGVQVKGLFYGAPYYDVPALMAFFTILITTVNFVVSVEVNFYPKYRNYNSLYSDNGTAADIVQAEREMLEVLRVELFYTALKQLLCTVLAVALGGYILDLLPLGFNETMKGYFRTLCIGYGLYAIGNMLMLILLYFVDYAGACIATAVFGFGSVILTVAFLYLPAPYYGFGFLLASLLFVIITLLRLDYYTKRLPYYILCVQPLVSEETRSTFTKLGERLDSLLHKEKNHADQETV